MNADSKVILNNVEIPVQEMTVTINAVDYDSGRNADGTMERNMLGEKRKVELSLPPLHSDALRPVMAAISGTEHAAFTASFPDPWVAGGVYSGEFYVGDRSAPVYNFALDIWNNVKFNIVEY